MSRLAGLFVVFAVLAAPAVALSDDRCRVPLADWRPREALSAKLEGQGWRLVKIRADDGCYKVVAVDRDGRVVKARFDPATLDRIEGGERDHHGHGRGDDPD
ncbi:MAG: PepSY domain-containing protein [Hyphomicrobiales bacterium]|nr:PepSY domain-containing protein [Hyphomicrobiales bacterium]